MAFVNVGIAINKALTKIVGSPLRSDLVTWFNEIMRDIWAQPRDWFFITQPIVLNISSNTIQIPSGVMVESIQIGATFYTTSNQLSAEEAAAIDNADSSEFVNSPLVFNEGYTLDSTGLVIFHPPVDSTITTATIQGEIAMPADYADNADTIFPVDPFEQLFVVGLRQNYYDVNKDGRFTKENTQYQIEMSKCKAWDNRHKAQAHYTPHGYIRG